MNYIVNVQVIKKQIDLSTQSCGVYKMTGEKGKVLYVGKAKNLKLRLSNYLRFGNLSERVKVMLSQIVKIETFLTKNEIEALLLESRLIKSLKPTYNIKLKDGKSYPYITISKHDYPSIAQHRGKLKKGEFHYYGPFTSATAVKQTILSLQKAFLLRGCSDKSSPQQKGHVLSIMLGAAQHHVWVKLQKMITANQQNKHGIHYLGETIKWKSSYFL